MKIDMNMLNENWWIATGTWTYTFFTVIIAIAACKTYQISLNQNQVDNAYKAIALIDKAMKKRVVAIRNDIKLPKNISKLSHLISILDASSESSGTPQGSLRIPTYIDYECKEVEINDVFRFGSPDCDVISDFLDITELICQQSLKKVVDSKLIIYEYGQLLFALHNQAQNGYFKQMYPYYNKFIEKHKKEYVNLPVKLYFRIC